ncbi:hypothetical protein ElyMa_001921300 [Elysia marginata]|uniref:Uncharacterized protein n=1 Tax=Elysia marginata TaxID=1093978 RepID=A0AAV4ETN5_9GAST|nr:hypothetical protein ElyMa_001921300 [Elysia marginata]
MIVFFTAIGQMREKETNPDRVRKTLNDESLRVSGMSYVDSGDDVASGTSVATEATTASSASARSEQSEASNATDVSVQRESRRYRR